MPPPAGGEGASSVRLLDSDPELLGARREGEPPNSSEPSAPSKPAMAALPGTPASSARQSFLVGVSLELQAACEGPLGWGLKALEGIQDLSLLFTVIYFLMP